MKENSRRFPPPPSLEYSLIELAINFNPQQNGVHNRHTTNRLPNYRINNWTHPYISCWSMCYKLPIVKSAITALNKFFSQRIICQRVTNPLSSLPGPQISKWTGGVLTYHWFFAHRTEYIHKLHQEYGEWWIMPWWCCSFPPFPPLFIPSIPSSLPRMVCEPIWCLARSNRSHFSRRSLFPRSLCSSRDPQGRQPICEISLVSRPRFRKY